MKITNNTSFGKTLVATCQLPTIDKGNLSCQIFELNNNDDKDYFHKLDFNSDWDGSKFVWVMKRLMDSSAIGKSNDTFTIENSEGDCLGYINVITHEKPYNKKSLQYIETCPKYAPQKKGSAIPYIGESLVAFIVEQAKRENREQVITLAFDSETRKFFKKHCGFKYGQESNYDCVLSKNDYPKFLKNHKEKVGSEITFIA